MPILLLVIGVIIIGVAASASILAKSRNEFDGRSFEYLACRLNEKKCKPRPTPTPTPTPTPPIVVDPAIQVIYPNGGEIITAGETVKIRWDGIQAGPPVKISLDDLTSGNDMVIAENYSGPNRLYSWTVPVNSFPRLGRPAIGYKITVANKYGSDSSDNGFYIHGVIDIH